MPGRWLGSRDIQFGPVLCVGTERSQFGSMLAYIGLPRATPTTATIGVWEIPLVISGREITFEY